MKTKDEALKMAYEQGALIEPHPHIPEMKLITFQEYELEAFVNCIRKEALEQPAQKPLSDDEINKLWKESCKDVRGLNLGFTTQQHYFAWLIEQAHEIGERDGQTHNSSNEWNISGISNK
jgi:hypothetical protein